MSLHVSEESDGQEIALVVGETLTLTLLENPTTGYLWRLIKDGSPVCELLRDTFEPGKDTPGSPGAHHWQFRADARGTGMIELQLSRSWHSSLPVRTFILTIRV
jgi:inhibitor of cysteine peptidase